MNWRIFWHSLFMHLVFYNIMYFSEFGVELVFYYMFFEFLFLFVFHVSEKTAGKVWIRGYNGRLKRSENFRFSDLFPFFIRFFLVPLEQLIFF